MKHFFLSLFIAFIALGISAPDAEARRLGGGGSFGMKRNVSPQKAPAKPAASPQQSGAGAAAANKPGRSWMGPIAGLAAGLGLAALFSHLGLGEGMANLVMIMLLVAAAVFIFRMLRRRQQGSSQPMQFAGAGQAPAAAPASQPAWSAPGSSAAPAPTASPDAATLPADFDAEGFARQAKLNFIRLQAANDNADLDDLRAFTTPEVFAELSMQLRERGDSAQRTDVIELNAEVLEVSEEEQRYIVSVRFAGSLREEAEAAPVAFDEIWHLTKPVQGSDGWRVAGIQQNEG